MVRQLVPAGIFPLLTDPRLKVRMKAVKDICDMGAPSSVQALSDLLHREQDLKVMGATVSALRALGGDDVADALVYAIQAPHADGWTRGACAMELAKHPGNPRELEALIRALRESGYVRKQAALALARYDDPRAAAAVSEAFAAGAIKPPAKTSLVPVAIARTLDVFVGDEPVRQALHSLIGPDTPNRGRPPPLATPQSGGRGGGAGGPGAGGIATRAGGVRGEGRRPCGRDSL